MGLRLKRNARFGIGRGMVMARALPAAAAASGAAAAEAVEREPLHAVDGDPATVPKVVGACSMHGRDRGLLVRGPGEGEGGEEGGEGGGGGAPPR